MSGRPIVVNTSNEQDESRKAIAALKWIALTLSIVLAGHLTPDAVPAAASAAGATDRPTDA